MSWGEWGALGGQGRGVALRALTKRRRLRIGTRPVATGQLQLCSLVRL